MKLIAAGLGYNNLFVSLGVFTSQAKAEETFIAAGCIRKMASNNKVYSEGIYVTQAFQDWMNSHRLSCCITHADLSDGLQIQFQYVEVDTISSGYDDDD